MSEAPTSYIAPSADSRQRRFLVRWLIYSTLASVMGAMVWTEVKEKKELVSACDTIIAEIWPWIPKNLSNVEKTEMLQTAFDAKWSEKEVIHWEVRDGDIISSKKNPPSLLPTPLFRSYTIQSDNTLKPFR